MMWKTIKNDPQELRPPLFVRPEILLHPNIPKPLHGTNPRTLLGKDWWDEKRQVAYEENNYCCWACGVHKLNAKYHKWLEAHECYEINYAEGKAEMVYISALCHSCHNYIHSGRMQMILGTTEMPPEKFTEILKHGDDIVGEVLKTKPKNPFIIGSIFDTANWSDWKLVIDKKEYSGKFKDIEEWYNFYNKR